MSKKENSEEYTVALAEAIDTIRQNVFEHMKVHALSNQAFAKKGGLDRKTVDSLMNGSLQDTDSLVLFNIFKVLKAISDPDYKTWTKKVGRNIQCTRATVRLPSGRKAGQGALGLHKNTVGKIESGAGFQLGSIVTLSQNMDMSWQNLLGYKPPGLSPAVRPLYRFQRRQMDASQVICHDISVARYNQGLSDQGYARQSGTGQETLRRLRNGYQKAVASQTLHRLLHQNGHVAEPDYNAWAQSTGQRIANFRASCSFNQTSLGSASGLSRNTIISVEKGKFTSDSIEKIAGALGVRFEALLYDEVPEISAFPSKNSLYQDASPN